MSLCDKALEHLKSIIIGIPLRVGIYQVLKMRVAIKRLLRRFGYPPDMQLLATETVIKQAEMISAELISNK